MNTLVAYLEYQKSKYYIYLLKNNRILFLKSNKYNKFTSNLSQKETDILTKIYKSLHINKDKSTYIKDIEVNNNIYNLFFDPSNHNYFWTPINGKYNDIDNKYLNFKYNNEPVIQYQETENNNNFINSNFYTKFIKLGKKLLPILVSASLSLTLLTNTQIVKPEIINEPTQSIIETIETTPTETISLEDIEIEEPSIEYNYEEIAEAINNNQNIGQSEKEFLSKLKFIFDENYQYMDLVMVKAKLQTLKIRYGVNLQSANASYKLLENEICIEAESFDSTNKATFLHEFLHSLLSSGKPLIGELSTEFFTIESMIRMYKEGIVEKEFFLSQYAKGELEKGTLKLNDENAWLDYLINNGRFSSGYQGYVNAYIILADLLPEETLRNYQFNPKQIEILSNALVEIDKNTINRETSAYQLIDSINSLREYSQENNTYNYSRDLSTCYEMLNYYFTQTKNISIEQDIYSSLLIQLESKLQHNLDINPLRYLNDNHELGVIGEMIPKTKLSNACERGIFVYYDRESKLQLMDFSEELKNEYIENMTIKANTR